MDKEATRQEPLFVDYVGSNLRLQSISPCINALRALLVTHPLRASRTRTPLLAGGSFRISFAIFVFFCEDP